MQPHIRLATAGDLESINRIYNHYVLHSVTTYQEEPETIADRRLWFARHGADHPVTVAEIDGAVVGWAALSPFHARSAYRRTVENAVYVDEKRRRQGIGRALLDDLLHRASALGHHSVIALIDSEQIGSIALHESLGFRQVGHLREAGFKFDRWLDVVYLQKLLQLPTVGRSNQNLC
jgi:L-amino acid N-acyltransferase YncA